MSARIKYPSIVFVASLLLAVFFTILIRTKPAPVGIVICMLLPIAIFVFAALHYGERTFFPARANRRTRNLTPRMKQILSTAQVASMWAYFLGMVTTIALSVVSIQHIAVFLTVSTSFLFLSSTLADLLDQPLYRPRSSIQSLNL